jgi:uracil-DNA glycosylase family 4
VDRCNVQAAVRACTRCPLYAAYSGPVPFSGPSPATVAVIAEAPGREEDRAREPLIGRAGRLLRAAMERVGFDWDEVARLNVVSCWPNRTPSRDEVDACKVNVAMQLEVIQPKYMLVCGKVAVEALVPGVVFKQMRGEWWRYEAQGQPESGRMGNTFTWLAGSNQPRDSGISPESTNTRDTIQEVNCPSRRQTEAGGVNQGDWGTKPESSTTRTIWCLSTYHPAAILRNPYLAATLNSDLTAFRFYSLGVFDPPVSQFCVVCGAEKGMLASEWDNGVGRCARHRVKVQKEKVVKAGKGQVNQDQGTLC